MASWRAGAVGVRLCGMTTEEIQIKRVALENAISDLLRGFMDESGLLVTSVDVDHYDITDVASARRKTIFGGCRVRAELP